MDKTKLYVKMADCPEIQDNAPKCMVDSGRFLVVYQEDNVWHRQGAKFNNAGFCVNNARLIWLPYQHQIQEMMGCVAGNHVETMRDLVYKAEYFVTLEQMWLAFYMHEKHQKIWNGTEWVKE